MPVALGVGIGALALVAFLYSLAYAYNYSLGALILWIVQGLQSLPSLPLVGKRVWNLLASPFQAVDNAVRHAIGVGIQGSEAVWNYVWGYVSYAITEAAEAIAGTAEDVYRVLDHYKRYLIPALIAATFDPLAALVYALKKQPKAIVHTATHTITRVVTKTERVTVTKAAAVAHTLPLPRIGHLEREAADIQRRLKDAARRIGPAAILAGLIAAIGRLGIGWIRCSKVGKLGKQVCGMNEDLLESLLADALLVVGTISIVEFAKELQAIEDATVAALRGFVREI